MNSKIFFIGLISAHLCMVGQSQRSGILHYVDPMIGTAAHGHTFPGSTRPFGMVQLSPSNDAKGWDWCSGYHYSDSVIKGFAHTHLSGTGLSGLGDILLMPSAGEVQVKPGTERNPESGYRSRFSHKDEHASPGYYSVLLKEENIKVELTATKRTGIHKYTYNDAGTGNVIIDPTHNIAETIYSTEIEFVSTTEIRGFKNSGGAGGNRKVYFVARFSKPVEKYGIAINDSFTGIKTKASGKNTKAFVTFHVKKKEEIIVRVGISFVSYEGARKNLDAEAGLKKFEIIKNQAINEWAQKMRKIEVAGATDKEKRIFYTALYHSMIAPNLISDVDGQYIIEGELYKGSINQYSTFSTWDTFRSQHPLLTILEPGITGEIVNSLITRHTVSKVELPIWELTGHDNACMTSYTPVSVIVDAVLKGIPGINKEEAYAAIKAAAMFEPKTSHYSGEKVLPYLKKYGYVPSNIVQSVSHNMEYAYQDWCIYRLANELKKYEDTAYFLKRSRSYLNLYRADKAFIWPKDTLGNWAVLDLNDWTKMQRHYITGNIWGYTSFIPQNISNLIALKGGKKKFCEWVDAVIADTAQIGGEQHVDLSGFIGKYGHGDEPSHHFAYLYNYAGQPWKTQSLVRQVMQLMYDDKPDGLINNEDCGQMSAWYVLSALGIYSFCPGDLKYTVGSPLFSEAVIHLDNGKDFRIKAVSNSFANKYIKSASLNNMPFNKLAIAHQELLKGGTLTFRMNAKPSHTWAVDASASPDYQDKYKIPFVNRVD